MNLNKAAIKRQINTNIYFGELSYRRLPISNFAQTSFYLIGSAIVTVVPLPSDD